MIKLDQNELNQWKVDLSATAKDFVTEAVDEPGGTRVLTMANVTGIDYLVGRTLIYERAERLPCFLDAILSVQKNGEPGTRLTLVAGPWLPPTPVGSWLYQPELRGWFPEVLPLNR